MIRLHFQALLSLSVSLANECLENDALEQLEKLVHFRFNIQDQWDGSKCIQLKVPLKRIHIQMVGISHGRWSHSDQTGQTHLFLLPRSLRFRSSREYFPLCCSQTKFSWCRATECTRSEWFVSILSPAIFFFIASEQFSTELFVRFIAALEY